MKRVLLFFAVLSLVAMFSSCAKDETMVSGTVSFVDVDDGQEYVKAGIDVYLMLDGSNTEYFAKTTTDSDGNYSFYPVDDGDYYVYAEYTDILQLHKYSGQSVTFTAKGKKDIQKDVVMH